MLNFDFANNESVVIHLSIERQCFALGTEVDDKYAIFVTFCVTPCSLAEILDRSLSRNIIKRQIDLLEFACILIANNKLQTCLL
ncbi:hypothetical protein C0431_01615 [bacterium]|nr:hypothetical protein [bacterium]